MRNVQFLMRVHGGNDPRDLVWMFREKRRDSLGVAVGGRNGETATATGMKVFLDIHQYESCYGIRRHGKTWEEQLRRRWGSE